MEPAKPFVNQFSLRTLFALVTISAFVFAIVGWLVRVPVLKFMVYFYLPVFIVYFLVRGPFLYRRWRQLRREYADVSLERRAMVDQARAERQKRS